VDQYLDYYALKEDPFRLTPDPAFYYPSPEHVTALMSLEYCMEHREGFCCITGEPGTGKTTVLRMFLAKWQDRAEIAVIMTPRLSPEEFLQAVLEDLNVPLPRPSKNEMLKAFQHFLITQASTGRAVAIVVDEAQNLPTETLEELRLLSNLETDKDKLLQIILVGQPELAVKLQDDRLKQLNQRITVRARLRPLAADQAVDYVRTRLIKAGSAGGIFDEQGLRRLHALAGGVPRVINIIAARALMVGYLQSVNILGEQEVALAGEEAKASMVGGSGAGVRSWNGIWNEQTLMNLSIAVMTLLVAAILIIGVWRQVAK
jgi:general secretion pathway protein A